MLMGMSEPKQTPSRPDDQATGTTADGGSVKGRLAGNLLLYTLARLAIVVVLTLIITFGGQLVIGQPVPLLVAALIAVIIAMPLSAYLLRGWNRTINADVATLDAKRRTRKEDLRRRMNG